MKKTAIFLLSALFCVGYMFGQSFLGEKESLAFLHVGDEPNSVQYRLTEEDYYSPNGPIVDENGTLFFILTTSWEKLIKLRAGSISEMPFPEGWPMEAKGSGVLEIENTQGIVLSPFRSIILKNGKFVYTDFSKYLQGSLTKDLGEREAYATPWGYLIDFPSSRKTFALEMQTDGTYKILRPEELHSWLPTKQGGYTIGNDGYLYRYGFLYSAIIPENLDGPYHYLGRLSSGHIIWAGGGFLHISERFFVISRPTGNIEETLELPWAPMPNQGPKYYNYSLGSWGELYCLLPPQNKSDTINKKVFDPDPNKPAELVVVRNHLKVFGRLNDSNVRLRKDPSTTADILGTYPAKTGFRIIEKGTKQETIGGKTDYWYHVRLLDGKEGWFFGSFVANLYDGPGTPPPWPNVADW